MAMAAGALFDIGGNALLGASANKKRKEFERMMGELREPDVAQLQSDYFGDLERYQPRASALSNAMRSAEMDSSLALRERALPGIGAATQDALGSIAPLLRGELPQGVLNNFMRAGGAQSMALGMGGSGFDALNTGLFGARGSLGAVQTGMGLLPALLQTMPNVSSPSAGGLLANLMTPAQRSTLEMQLRAQQIGLNTQLSGMPTGMDVWGMGMKQAGGMLMGGGMGGQQAWASQNFGMGGGGDAPRGSYGALPGANRLQGGSNSLWGTGGSADAIGWGL